MGPFHIPWSTFSSLFLALAAVVIALLWVWADKVRERKEGEE